MRAGVRLLFERWLRSLLVNMFGQTAFDSRGWRGHVSGMQGHWEQRVALDRFDSGGCFPGTSIVVG